MDDEMKPRAAEQSIVDWHTSELRAECIGIDYYSCEEAIKRLNEYLDQQLTPEERAVVLKHLEICKPCLRRFSFEQTLIVSLRQKITRLRAPETLRDRLQSLLRPPQP